METYLEMIPFDKKKTGKSRSCGKHSRAVHMVVLVSLLILFCSHALAANKQMRVTNPASDTGLLVMDASAPEFMETVRSLLTPEAMGKASSFLPQSIVIVNNTGKYVWGFTVVYQYPDWISPAGTAWKHRISPSGGGPADRNRMLAPGARFLVTPVSDFLASRDSSGNWTLHPYLDEGMDRMISQFKAQHQESDERIEVLIDSVIFEDGLIAGPDSEKMMDRVNERIRAQKDLAASLENLHGESLRGKLMLHSHKGAGDDYSVSTSAAANGILSVLNEHGEAVALETVRKMRTSRWFVNSENVRRK